MTRMGRRSGNEETTDPRRPAVGCCAGSGDLRTVLGQGVLIVDCIEDLSYPCFPCNPWYEIF